MEGTNTTNAVECNTCKTNNSRYAVNCKKCGKKLGFMDRHVYDSNLEIKPITNTKSTKATPTSMLVFLVVFGVLFYFALKFLNVGGSKKVEHTTGSYGTLSKLEFISKVKENTAVIDADITDVNYLYIAVIDDGNNKDAMATFYCRLAKEYNMSEVSAVKIVDAATARLPKNGTAEGKELGKSFCN